jgi:exopolysaccharide biosynthesis polyprenyl glycosylphosphotransferase
MVIIYAIAAGLLAALIAIRSGPWLVKMAYDDPAAPFTRTPVLLRQSHDGLIGAGANTGALDLDTVDMRAVNRAAAAMTGHDISQFKRILDVVLSLGLIVSLAPLLVLTALAIKLDSRGPVLYRQRRVGKDGKLFEVYKFRSMRIDAEKDGPQYARVNDDRVTRIGRLIRKTRIDEIPQAMNVLRGEMSFVGPRPERPEFVAELERAIPHYRSRQLVKPGITGWAQVKYEYAATVEGASEKLRYDLYYIRNFTPLLDIIIIVMTIRVAVFGIGSR